jgi:TctA family transporter
MGFAAALTPWHLLVCLIGVALGTLVGVLPGLGPIATMAMLLPLTYAMTPLAAMIMLAGIYYGAQYGGSTTAILVNLPGESSSLVTCLDGHAMARDGRAGVALGVAAIGSLFAGIVTALVVALFAPALAVVALRFGPADYFSLMVLGLVAAVVLASGDLLKAIAMTVLGVLLGLVGTDVTSGDRRMTFGVPELVDGIGFVCLGVGLFGIAEIAANLERRTNRDSAPKVARLLPNRAELRAATPATLRGTAIGALLGVLPGGGAMLGAFAAYVLEKKLARDPARFGRGAIEGVAAPESANNAGAQTAFIPMLTLGLPPNAVMAMLIGALQIHGIVPGPRIIAEQPALFWGLIASMLIGNAMLVLINLPLIGIWVRLLRAPYRLLFPAILVFCAIGVYSTGSSTFEVLLAAGIGVVGYGLRKLGCEAAPLLLGFVVGPLLEENLRRALIYSRGDLSVLASEPLSLVFLAIAAIMLALVLAPGMRRTRAQLVD